MTNKMAKKCKHKHRSPVTVKGYNLVVCSTCPKRWLEGELKEWRKR